MPITEAKVHTPLTIKQWIENLPLLSARLRLRLPQERDALWIEPAVSDPHVSLMTGSIPHPYPPGHAALWIENSKTQLAAGTSLNLIIERQADNIGLGVIGLHFNHDTEIGYWLAPEFWQHGYATEAADRLLSFAFDHLGIHTVIAGAFMENFASLAVQKKLGFRFLREEEKEFSARGRRRHLVQVITQKDHLDHRSKNSGCAGSAGLDAAPTKTIFAVAAALIDADGRVLLAQRPQNKPMAGLWEFPGGKVTLQETPEAALIRELKEELDIDTSTSCLAPIAFASHRYPDFHLLMPLYACRVWQGTPRPQEGQTLAWIKPARLMDYPMPPADIPLIPLLRDLL